jgi:amino acid transporter
MVQGTRYAWLDHHKVFLCLIFITFIALANLRGVRESGSFFAAPTYAFLISFLFMIGYGLFSYYTYGGAAPVPRPEEIKTAEGYNLQPLTLFLLLGAFSNGCAALTGIEAISNGVPAFKKPEAKNAATTLVIMALLLTTMFLGTASWLISTAFIRTRVKLSFRSLRESCSPVNGLVLLRRADRDGA